MASPEITGEKKRRTGKVRLLIGAAICLALFLVWGMLLSGQLSVSVVGSDSMAPTLKTGDRLIVKALDPDEELHRNMIVTFRSPDDQGAPLVKRLVALPGDTVGVQNGVLHVNDEDLPLFPGAGNPRYPRTDFQFSLGPDQYFVLGDNRTFSHDSTQFGPIGRDIILGEVIYRYSPLSRMGKVE